MAKDSELIEKMKQASKAIEEWPESMKKMRRMRLQADAYLAEKESDGDDAHQLITEQND